MASVEERLKLKRGQVDTWSTKEKLCLASCVLKCGNQNWMSVSRNLKVFAGEPGRPPDWFSQKSCAVQYDCLLDRVETPKRKKRGADGTKSEGSDISPGELIVKQLVEERIDELKKRMAEVKAMYIKDKEDVVAVESGMADDRLDEFLQQIQEEKKQKEKEQEAHQKWLKEREERKQEMEWAWRPFSSPQQYRGPASGAPSSQNSTQAGRRPRSQSEVSEADSNVDSPHSVEIAGEETVEANPTPTPTSPLLTSLLKSPSQAQSSSILHSAITSQRGASPTITSLLNSSPSIPNNNSTASPNIKALVSNALASRPEDAPKSVIHTASGSPTLSMLLELPPAIPGQPLPELPSAASIQTTVSTAVSPAASNTVSPAAVTAVGTASTAPIQLGDVKSDSLPDISAMDIMMPVETEANIAEAERGLNIEADDLQHLSHADLELVMDPIDMVLGEGDISLVEEMAVLIEVSSDEVGNTVNSVLDMNSKDAMAVAAQAQRLQAEAEAQIASAPAAGALMAPGLLPESQGSVPPSPVQLASPPPTASPLTPKDAGTPKKNKAQVAARKIDLEVPVEEGAATSVTPEPIKDDQNDSTEMMEAYVEPKAEDVMRTVGLSEEALEDANIVIIQDDGEFVKVSGDACLVEKKPDIEQTENKEVAESAVIDTVVETEPVAVADTPSYTEKVEEPTIVVEVPKEIPKEELNEFPDKLDSAPAIESPKKETKPAKVKETKLKRNSRDVDKELERREEKKEDVRRNPLRKNEKREDKVKAVSSRKDEAVAEEAPRKVEKYAPSEQDILFDTSQDLSLHMEPTSLDEDIREEEIMREVSREEVEKTILGIPAEKVEVFIPENEPSRTEAEATKVEEIPDKAKKEETPEKSKKDEISEKSKKEEVSEKPKKDEISEKSRKDEISEKSKKDESPSEKIRKEEARSSRDSVKGRQRRNSRREKSPDIVDSPAEIADDIPVERKERETSRKERKASMSQENEKGESRKTEVSSLKKEEKEVRRKEEEPKFEEEQDRSTAGRIAEMAETADDNSRPGDSDKESSVKYDKTNRSDTPSTEDDKTSDIEQQSTRSASTRRARSARDYSDSIPSSPASTHAISDEEKDYRAWKKSIMLVYGRIAAHKSASLFLRPITDDKAPGYSQIIYRPMDLFTMKKNIENGVIRTTAEFQRDILLMFNNAIMYNKSGSHVHSMASAMQEEGVQILKEFVNTQLLLQAVGSDGSNVPSRRGTRTTEKRDQEGDKTSTPKSGNTPTPAPSTGSSNTFLQAGKRKRSIVPEEKIVSKRRKADDS